MTRIWNEINETLLCDNANRYHKNAADIYAYFNGITALDMVQVDNKSSSNTPTPIFVEALCKEANRKKTLEKLKEQKCGC